MGPGIAMAEPGPFFLPFAGWQAVQKDPPGGAVCSEVKAVTLRRALSEPA